MLIVHWHFSKVEKLSLMLLWVEYFQYSKEIKWIGKIRRIRSIMATMILWKNIKNKFFSWNFNRRHNFQSILTKKINLKKRNQNTTNKENAARIANTTYLSKSWQYIWKSSKRDLANCLFIVSSKMDFKKYTIIFSNQYSND